VSKTLQNRNPKMNLYGNIILWFHIIGISLAFLLSLWIGYNALTQTMNKEGQFKAWLGFYASLAAGVTGILSASLVPWDEYSAKEPRNRSLG
jgi:hypothetical protein